MSKQEIKEELELYKNINNELTTKICYLLLWKNKFIKARISDWIIEEKVIEQINLFNIDFEIVKDKLKEHYKNKWVEL